MKTFWISANCVLVIAAVIYALQPQMAEARKPYRAEFEAMYVTPSTDQKFIAAAKAADCQICHVGDKKKDRNVYGQALAKLLTKDDQKDLAKIKAALESVAKEPSDPANATSPTFGDRIKSGKLPGG